MFERPLGIVLTALYAGVNTVLSVLVGFLGLIGMAVAKPEAATWVGLLSSAALAIGVVSGAVAYGLWMRQAWAPKLTLYTFWAAVALGVAALLYDRTTGNIILQLVGIAIALAVIRYIQKPEVNALFAPQPTALSKSEH